MAAQVIVKHGKPFTDGKYIKIHSLRYLNIYLCTLKTRVKSCKRSVTWHSLQKLKEITSRMAEDIIKLQIKDINFTVVYSIASDESKDKSDIEKIALFCRYVNSAGPQEIIELIPLKTSVRLSWNV